MTRSPRSVPRRALVLGATAVVAVGAGSTLALADGDQASPPRPKTLEQAVGDALKAPVPAGVTARITFTSRLPAGLAGAATAPKGVASLMRGAHGRVWASGDHLRVRLAADRGSARVELVVDGRRFWAYESGANTVVRGTLPARATDARAQARRLAPSAVVDALAAVRRHATISAPEPGVVGGRPAYTVKVAPREGAGLVRAELSWDAERALPLRGAVFLRGSDEPLAEARASDVELGALPASTWRVQPPAGATVVALPEHP
jgi:hypothetical protein